MLFGASPAFARRTVGPRWLGWLGYAGAGLALLSLGYLLTPLDNRSWLYLVLLVAAVLGFASLVLAGGALALRRLSGRATP